jgi:hypothetical protein
VRADRRSDRLRYIGRRQEPVNTVTAAIDGIGELTNEFRQQAAASETCGANPLIRAGLPMYAVAQLLT